MTVKVEVGDWVYWSEGESDQEIGRLLAIDQGGRTGWFKNDDGAYMTVGLDDLTPVLKCPTCGKEQ